MSFQRSYSKVWWGSDSQQLGSSFTSGGFYSHYNNIFQQQPQQHQHQHQHQPQQPASLDSALQRHLGHSGNLSSIQEVDDEQNSSKLSWHKHDSPGSLRSQDSGFSDNEDQHQQQQQQQQQHQQQQQQQQQQHNSPTATAVIATPSGSPTSLQSVATPPTVIRRVGKSRFYSPLVSVTRRISFSGMQQQPDVEHEPHDSVADDDNGELDASRSRLFEQIDSLQLDDDKDMIEQSPATPPRPAVRRRKRLARLKTAKLEQEELLVSDVETPPPPYNNETVYLGEAPPPYNNETVTFGGQELEPEQEQEQEQDHEDTLKFEALSPLRSRFTASTSTPKAKPKSKSQKEQQLEPEQEQQQATQSWLAEQRWNCEPEVMCMLQHKSIAQEAYKNFTITTSAVAKLMRQLQQQALQLQAHFERCERVLSGLVATTLPDALVGATQLLSHLDEFTCVLERRGVFFNDARVERRRYEQHLEQIRTVSKDTRYSLERQHYINLESLLDDVCLLKRHTLITIRLIFERLARILVLSIEQSRCDLLLRANINMVATLMNIDYDGFASLSDAFVQNEAVRALLLIVLDHKLSSVRALALRALATLCCAPQAIAQLGNCGGIDIVRDILQTTGGGHERGAIERREAVSLLAQITASWHGPEHRVAGLRACAESLVAGLAALLQPECCEQTLLLCAAALNNLSRMEVTSHYSIMSNEAIFKLISTLQHQTGGISVFLYEQIVGMLQNMSLNKKCHSHLANGIIINFITSVYQTEFYRTYDTRAECDAQRRSIKSILYTLTRLVQDSHTLAGELLEQWRLPDLLRQSLAAGAAQPARSASQLDQSCNAGHGGDISHLARQLLLAHQQEHLLLTTGGGAAAFSSSHQTPEAQASRTSRMSSSSSSSSSSLLPATSLKFNLTRQESFV
ncbi:uncharacterized protein LOC6559556 [Drosophila grimshawi]|uniref:GH19883 n=1 Tax=Drosophila grimshawi TaxID=7222 RepID=B4J977_DROGR|nr:uncharacterized protein LOC6559556 [Drosophila grimshawi]EDW02452.1 GH19883 [Drosophila grimshawi]